MIPMVAWLIGSAIMGEMKRKEQQAQFKEQQKVEAGRERWAPFTGQRGKTLSRPSSIDPIMQSMLAGAMMGQQMQGAGYDAAAQGQAPTGNVSQTAPQMQSTTQFGGDPYGAPQVRQPNMYSNYA